MRRFAPLIVSSAFANAQRLRHAGWDHEIKVKKIVLVGPLKELNYTVVEKKHEMGEIVIGKKQCHEFMEHRVLQCFLSIF